MGNGFVQADSLLGVVCGHPFEEVSEFITGRVSFVYLPKKAFVLVCQALVVGVVEGSTAERPQLGSAEE